MSDRELTLERVAAIFGVPLYVLDSRYMAPYTMFPCHDHFIEEPMTGAGGTFALGIRAFDGYNHDWRCMGACHRCGGGHTPYLDTPELRCLYCERGECSGCNAYNNQRSY